MRIGARRLGEQGGAHVVARARRRRCCSIASPPATSLAPSALAIATYSRSCASCLSSTTGPMSVPFLRASSTFSVFMLLGHRSDEAVVDAFGDDQARGRRAALAGGEEAAVQRRVHRDVQVGVVEHDHRILAAHLQLELGHARDAGLRDALAGGHRAGEADRVDALVVQQHLAHFGAAAHHQVEHARRQARAVQDVGDGPGAAGHQIGRLEHHGVAVGQGRGDLPGGDRDGEVPGRDQAHDAHGLARDFHADARAHGRHHLAAGTQRFAGKELEDVAGACHLADGLGQGLAFLAREQVAQFGLARQDLGAGGVEDVEALLRGGQAPGGLGLGGCGDGLRWPGPASACAYSPTTSRVSEGLMLRETRGPSTHSPPIRFLNMVWLRPYMLASSIAS